MADIAGLRLFLRDSDDVKASIQVLSIPDSQDTSTSDTQLINAVSPIFKTILSVISHKDSVDQHEEGSVFVLREKSPSQTLEIERLIPVCGDFSVSIMQMRLGSSSQDRAGFRITVSPGHPDDPLSFFTRDAEGLQIVLAECRRLKDLSEYFIPASPSQTYSWLTSYNSEHTIPTITTVPPDIRFAQQPIHRRLSPASAGTPGDDTHDLHLLRDEWVRSRAREQTRDGSASLDIRIGTFNVNGQPPTQDLASWVRGKSPVGNGFIPPLNDVSPFTADIDEKDPLESQATITSDPPYTPSNGLADVFVFAFQELDLSTEALIYATSTAKEDAWCTAIFASLGEHQSFYTKLVSKQLVGMLIVIIVRKSLAHRFGDVKTCAAGVGMMGMGNKGGTAVQVTYKPADGYDVDAAGGMVVTFVNSHLAAFDEMVERRNSDFNDLSKRLVFGGGDGESSADIWETDVLFWVGDLNYRLDQPDADVRELLLDANKHDWAKKRNMDALTEYDQLKSSMRSGKAFQDFCEFDIGHMPSYRFSPGILVDSLGYDLKRKPAWTDRILHLKAPAVKLRQHSYTVYPHITMSDHKPVSADFTLEVDVYDEKSRLTASRKLYRQLEGLERESKRLIVEPDEVKVGEIRYKQTVVRQLTLRNDGKTPCAFRFVSPIEGGAIHPPWLAIEPLAGIVMPNQPFEIAMSVCVDDKTPYFSRELDCTLVLHAGPGLGKDRFVVVQGEYQMSCAGVPLTKLVQLPGPIRTTYGDKSAKHDLNAPREVMRLVNWMMDHRLADAFHRESDGDVNAGKVRECLDTGADFPEGLPSQAYGAVLLEFLLGIVPADVKVDGVHNREEAFEVLDSFPIVNVNVWISVTAFLHYIVHGSPERVNEIAAVLAPVVFSEVTASIMEKRRFVRYFIDLE